MNSLALNSHQQAQQDTLERCPFCGVPSVYQVAAAQQIRCGCGDCHIYTRWVDCIQDREKARLKVLGIWNNRYNPSTTIDI